MAPRSGNLVQAPFSPPYGTPPTPYEHKSTFRQDPQPPSSACRPGKRKGTGNDRRKTGPREEPAINKPQNTGLPRSHKRAQLPWGDSRRPHLTAAQAGTQGKKGHPSAHGSGNPSTGVDPGALLARLEEQKRGVIQDEQQHKAITEEQEASGDPQRHKDPCHNTGQAQKLDGTSASAQGKAVSREGQQHPHLERPRWERPRRVPRRNQHPARGHPNKAGTPPVEV